MATDQDKNTAQPVEDVNGRENTFEQSEKTVDREKGQKREKREKIKNIMKPFMQKKWQNIWEQIIPRCISQKKICLNS